MPVALYIQSCITRLAAVTTHNWIFRAMIEQGLLEMLGQVVRDDELALDDALGPCMRAFEMIS